MNNIEFKAELRDLESARRQCGTLGATRIGFLRQTDEYYRMTEGRLKRRTAPGEPVEWIVYERPDLAAPRMSRYTLLSEEQARRRYGHVNLKPWLRVVKTRELWMVENVRIHLDEVEQLGCFIEFEAVMSDDHDEEDCREIVDELREAFGPLLGEAVGVSYCDLMAGRDEETERGRA